MSGREHGTGLAALGTTGTQVSALVDAARTGVDCDGLRVEERADGFAFETPEERHVGLAEDALRDVAAEHPRYVSNWYVWAHEAGGEVPRAFCRWVEGADDSPVPERYDALTGAGVTRTWGELRLTATVDAEGHRSYEVRHHEDADEDRADLAVHRDPYAARDLATFDERERYRPLKTAPTLQQGWAFVDLAPGDLVQTVDLLYPATVHNWHREREGELDVSDWRDTAERQTGIYDLVAELPPAAVEWMAEACCVDSQCLKRREWEYDDATELDVDPGEGEFPCREPCSLVVAAARKWTLLEREEPRTYEFELTPSEKEQVEEIIDAVAAGRVEEIREADVYEGANRYRARYLRAKRFDEAGNLSGTPTGDDAE